MGFCQIDHINQLITLSAITLSCFHFIKNLFIWLILRRSPPIVIHCTTGACKTGTLIAFETLADAVDENRRTVDVFGVVYNMRKDRPAMVRFLLIFDNCCKQFYEAWVLKSLKNN